MDRRMEKGKSILKFLGVLYILYEIYTLMYITHWFDVGSMVFPIIYSIGRIIILFGVLSLISIGKNWARIMYILFCLLALYTAIMSNLEFELKLYKYLSIVVILINLFLITNKNVTAYMGRPES